MDPDVQILTGTAGSGKTRALLTEYRGALRTCAETENLGRTLWLTPTRHSRRQVLADLPDDSYPVCFAPNVLLFSDFAEKLLRSSGEPAELISPSVRQRLIRTIIDSLRMDKRLPYFSPIASTSGFLQLVASFISELKREEIWPERFEEACAAGDLTDKDRELALIYATYQRRLLDAKSYDSEGRFWSARDVADRAGLGPFSQLSLVVVDGFSDFTHTQYELLAHLARDSETLRISLPLESPLERTDLFAKSQAACERLRNTLGEHVDVVTMTNGSSSKRRAAFEYVAKHLFTNPREQQQSDEANGIEVHAAAGSIREIEFLAGRIKQLLLDETPADDIVLAFRSLEDDTADLIRETFTAAQIPYHIERGAPLRREPVLNALFDVVRMELEDWPFERLMSVLRSSYFRPDWDNVDLKNASSALATFLRRHKLHSNRKLFLRVLKRERDHAGEAVDTRSEQEPETDRLQPLDDALTLMERFSDATDRLRGVDDFSGWTDRLVQLARDLGIAPRGDDPEDRRDSQTWDLFERLLFDVSRSDVYNDADTVKMTLAEFNAALGELLELAEMPAPGAKRGVVRVLAADGVRNIDVAHLFLAGLTESSFPSGRAEDCFYSETERQRLNERGLAIGHRTSHGQDEMLLFYGVVTRARQSLILSYPEIGTGGKPLFASPYLKAVRDLFNPNALPIQPAGELDPLPSRDRILSNSDLRRVATAEVHEGRPGLFAAMCDRPETQTVARNILAGVDANVARFGTKGWTNYEGIIERTSLRKRLAAKYTADYQFSATQLETYAACGYRFLMSDVLKLDPLDSPQVATDHLSRGVLVHKVLSLLHAATDDSPAVGDDPASVSEAFRAHVDDRLEKRINHTDLQRALVRVEGRLLHEWADAYGEYWSEYLTGFAAAWDDAPQPRHLETPFGDVPGEEEDDRSSTSFPSLKVGSGDAETSIRGRIDRVDLGSIDGQPVFNVVDYKSGRPPRFSLEDVQSGRSLQLALYTLAVLRFDLAGAGAKPFQMGYWSLRETGFVSGIKGSRKSKVSPIDDAVLDSLEAILDDLVPRLAAGIRSGVFPIDSDDTDCAARCPFGSVCRVTQIRPVREALEKTSKLTDLPSAAQPS